MPGLDPGIHPSSLGKFFRRRMVTGSSPVTTISIGVTVIATNETTRQSRLRHSGSGPSDHPGMTESRLLRGIYHRAHSRDPVASSSGSRTDHEPPSEKTQIPRATAPRDGCVFDRQK